MALHKHQSRAEYRPGGDDGDLAAGRDGADGMD